MKRAMFVGRFQPFHNGHKWLFEQKLSKGIPILVAIRDIAPDEKNPFTTSQTVDLIRTVYEDQGDMVKVIVIDDIESVNYGRGVGYEINEHVPPLGVANISATYIRDCISKHDDTWKELVDPKIHELVVLYLIENKIGRM